MAEEDKHAHIRFLTNTLKINGTLQSKKDKKRLLRIIEVTRDAAVCVDKKTDRMITVQFYRLQRDYEILG